MPTLTSSSSELEPPYPLTHMEQRALDRGEWTLVWNAVDQKVYFFNPSTRHATRHLQPLLLLRKDPDPCGQPRSPMMPVAAVLPVEPPADTIESLREALVQKTAELRAADNLARVLQRECLLLRHAALSSRKDCPHCPRIIAETPQWPEGGGGLSSAALNVLVASPLKAITTSSPHRNTATAASSVRSPRADHGQRQSIAADDAPSADTLERIAVLERHLACLTSVHLELLTHIQAQRT